jgi:hypothetical protein
MLINDIAPKYPKMIDPVTGLELFMVPGENDINRNNTTRILYKEHWEKYDKDVENWKKDINNYRYFIFKINITKTKYLINKMKQKMIIGSALDSRFLQIRKLEITKGDKIEIDQHGNKNKVEINKNNKKEGLFSMNKPLVYFIVLLSLFVTYASLSYFFPNFFK